MNKQYIAQIERAQRNINTHPYFLLSRGPSLKPCPIHAKNKGLVLSVDDDYWIEFPMREHKECKCGVRSVNKREYKKLKNEGTLDCDAPPILDESGRLTGNREKRYIPIIEKPIT